MQMRGFLILKNWYFDKKSVFPKSLKGTFMWWSLDVLCLHQHTLLFSVHNMVDWCERHAKFIAIVTP